jgi:hypothetical protein
MSSEPKESSGAIVAEDVLETLSQQCALYRRLKLLADRQHALVSSSASQELLAVLAERQKVISAIQAVDRGSRAGSVAGGVRGDGRVTTGGSGRPH